MSKEPKLPDTCKEIIEARHGRFYVWDVQAIIAEIQEAKKKNKLKEDK